MGALLVALVEGGVSGVADGVGGEVRLVIKGEVEGIVVNSLLLVLVVELEVVVEGVVGFVDRIRGLVEGKSVKMLYGAGGVGGSEAEPHEESG